MRIPATSANRDAPGRAAALETKSSKLCCTGSIGEVCQMMALSDGQPARVLTALPPVLTGPFRHVMPDDALTGDGEMKRTVNFASLLAAAAVAGLMVTGCQNRTEQAAEAKADSLENQADAVRAEGEQKADAIEENADKLDPKLDGKDSAAEQSEENRAQAVREGTEKKADSLENQADAVRDTAK